MAANIESILAKVKRYNPDADFALLRRALDYATAKHDGQKRKTGEPYEAHFVDAYYFKDGSWHAFGGVDL